MDNCGSGKRAPLSNLEQAEQGDVFYGGTFIYNESENFKSLYPLNVTETVSSRLANQIYEGLVRLDQQDLSVQPAIAKDWEIDSTATKYTFYLREGVKFHDDPCFPNGEGREVTAQDFKYCFDRLCEDGPKNQSYWIFKNKVKGADEYHQASKEGDAPEGGVEGVKVIDDYTLVIKLKRPNASFLNALAMSQTSVFPKEAVEKYGKNMRTNAVGTGPFKIKEIAEGEAVILTRNENYWGTDEHGNQLPYLDAIKVTFIGEDKSALLEFKKGNLDMKYRLPLEMVNEVVNNETRGLTEDYKEFQLQSGPALSLNYYGFQHQSDIFSNKKVRKAFNYAVDRQKLVKYTLKGVGIPANNGVVPPAIVGYRAKQVEGYELDEDKARRLLEEAGYVEGEGFPEITLQINSGGGRRIQVAEAVQKMLQENLNINVNVKVLPWPQHLERIETGKTKFWRSGWQADYPDPENFLNLFFGLHLPEEGERSYINTVRYNNSTYDSLLTLALKTQEEEKRNELYLKADQKAVDDAVIIPLYYERTHRLVQPYVQNFPQNPMEYRTFRNVYFKPPEKDEEDQTS
jgi:peptide/nickel transport system substrate-binding protein